MTLAAGGAGARPEAEAEAEAGAEAPRSERGGEGDRASWDQQLVLTNLYSVAKVTLRAKESAAHRVHLDALEAYAHDEGAATGDDARATEVLAAGVSDAGAARRLAARVRGMALGAAAHADTARREVGALARAAAGGEGLSDAALEARAVAAWERSRDDLERDVVRLGAVELAPSERGVAHAWLRRWGVVRWLELNGFVAAFTRDGTHAGATAATQRGRDAGALRFALAVAQAATAFPRDEAPEAGLEDDARLVEAALPALLASVLNAVRG